MGFLGMGNGENVTKRLQNLETRYAELMVKLSGLAEMQELQHQRLLRLEQAVQGIVRPKSLSERLAKLWPTT